MHTHRQAKKETRAFVAVLPPPWPWSGVDRGDGRVEAGERRRRRRRRRREGKRARGLEESGKMRDEREESGPELQGDSAPPSARRTGGPPCTGPLGWGWRCRSSCCSRPVGGKTRDSHWLLCALLSPFSTLLLPPSLLLSPLSALRSSLCALPRSALLPPLSSLRSASLLSPLSPLLDQAMGCNTLPKTVALIQTHRPCSHSRVHTGGSMSSADSAGYTPLHVANSAAGEPPFFRSFLDSGNPRPRVERMS